MQREAAKSQTAYYQRNLLSFPIKLFIPAVRVWLWWSLWFQHCSLVRQFKVKGFMEVMYTNLIHKKKVFIASCTTNCPNFCCAHICPYCAQHLSNLNRASVDLCHAKLLLPCVHQHLLPLFKRAFTLWQRQSLSHSGKTSGTVHNAKHLLTFNCTPTRPTSNADIDLHCEKYILPPLWRHLSLLCWIFDFYSNNICFSSTIHLSWLN